MTDIAVSAYAFIRRRKRSGLRQIHTLGFFFFLRSSKIKERRIVVRSTSVSKTDPISGTDRESTERFDNRKPKKKNGKEISARDNVINVF